MTTDFTNVYDDQARAAAYATLEPDKAVDRLESLLGKPYDLSPGWLRIDPTFDPIRRRPRFQRLAGNGT